MKKEKKTIKKEIEEIIKKELPEIHGRRLSKKLTKIIEFLICEVLQRFIKETKIESPNRAMWIKCSKGDFVSQSLNSKEDIGFQRAVGKIKRKQQQWLKKEKQNRVYI